MWTVKCYLDPPNLTFYRMVEQLLAPDMREGLSSQERQAVSDIALQLMRNQETKLGDLQAQSHEVTEPKAEHDSLIVNHVKGLLNDVIDAVVSYNSSSPNINTAQSQELTTASNIIVPTVIMVYNEEQEPNNSTSSSFSDTVVNSKSTYQNNSHLILIDNGDVTIFLLNKDNKQQGENHRESETIQSMSSSSSSNGDFQNITFSQVSPSPGGSQKNGSNLKMSGSGSSPVHFQNSTHHGRGM